jgi:hypothetical protein
MKKFMKLTGMVVVASAFLAGCLAPQTWPDYKRSAERKMVVIEEKIGDGLKTGSLSADQSQMFLTTLKNIRTDNLALRDRPVAENEWIRLNARLDALDNEIDRALARPLTTELPRSGDRILILQERIDAGRLASRWSQDTERDLQFRLDSIRQDYLRMTEGSRSTTEQERSDIARRLDALESDISLSR